MQDRTFATGEATRLAQHGAPPSTRRKGRRVHGGYGVLAILAALLALPACEVVDRARSQLGTTDTVSVAATGSGVMLGLQAPGMLRAGEEGVLRLSVTNRSDTTATDISLELIVPAWAVPMPPRAGDREVSMAALAEGGTRFAYRLQEAPLEPGQTQSIEQRIRVLVDGVMSGPDAPWNGVVRARLLGAGGEVLAEVEGHIGLSAAVEAGMPPPDGAIHRRDQIGPVRLGMRAGALRQAVSSARDTSWTQEGSARTGAWVPLGSDGRTLAVLSGDTVVRLEVSDAAVRTREGLGVGSRLEELRSEYGVGCADAMEGAVVVWFARAPGITFALDTAVPSTVAELRASPENLPGTATVTRWWIDRGLDGCTR
jgi:hypothetical protein